MNHVPQAPENINRVISNFVKNSGRYLPVKVHHWVNDTGGKFFTDTTGGK
jgi:hypothetical protein